MQRWSRYALLAMDACEQSYLGVEPLLIRRFVAPCRFPVARGTQSGLGTQRRPDRTPKSRPIFKVAGRSAPPSMCAESRRSLKVRTKRATRVC